MATRLPDANERTVIAAEAASGDDRALPASDKRSRAAISARTNIAAGTSVYCERNEYRLLGPGRGDGWALLGWVDDEASCCIGTFHESQFVTVRPAGAKND